MKATIAERSKSDLSRFLESDISARLVSLESTIKESLRLHGRVPPWMLDHQDKLRMELSRRAAARTVPDQMAFVRHYQAQTGHAPKDISMRDIANGTAALVDFGAFVDRTRLHDVLTCGELGRIVSNEFRRHRSKRPKRC